MPRSSDGAYSLPSGSLVNIGEDIVPSQHNPPLLDIAQAISDSLSRDGRGGMRAPFNGGGFRATNIAPGVQSTDAATVGQLAGSGTIPTGAVMDFAGINAPTGWLICAGQTLSRTDYANLFAAIGTAYGAPSNSTFNLPDCRGRVSAGRDVDQGGFAGRLTTPNAQTLGASGGVEAIALTKAQMPTHTHEVTGSTGSAGAHTHTAMGAVSGDSHPEGPGSPGGMASPVTTSSSGGHSHAINVSAANAGGNEAHPNVQPTIIFTKIIKV